MKPDVTVGIIGAGFSGLGMGIKLQKAGIDDFVIFEKAGKVGGTWRDSKYPGAAVDVPSHLYSYSFEEYTDWNRMFATSDEIEQYIEEVMRRHSLEKKIQFHTHIVSAKFDLHNGFWVLKTTDGKEYTARIVVGALGPFAKIKIPNIPGLDEFEGLQVHTAKWDKSIDWAGKRIALVGSGASAIQVGPAVAPKAKELKVFQRTPPWIVPKRDYVFSALEKQVYKTFPAVQKMRRYLLYSITEILALGIVFDTPLTDLLERASKRHMEKAIKDKSLLPYLTPDYRLGQTRMLISNDWYPMFNRKNVELVPYGVEALTKKGVVANGKEYEVDMIIWATGYQSPSQGFPFDIYDMKGNKLADLWAEGAEGYKGVAIANFPNMFTLMGPNTGPGHTSVLVYVEPQQDYALQGIQYILKNNLRALTVHPIQQKLYNEWLSKKMAKTTWGKGGKSWYYTKSGKNTTLYPGFASEYVLSIRKFNPLHYNAMPFLPQKSIPQEKVAV
ncbi:MAG: NAD(P)/FAD-dependent oxidoreductase [Candidatus Hydrogenedentota bacterium]|nr:MAG: NAD(P)/FAD-dependent oxidoreductase [Candidatus Hydrogenedentota bacterium]